MLTSGSTLTAPLALPAPVAPDADGGGPSVSGGGGLSGTTGDQGQEAVRDAEERLPSEGPSAAMALLNDSDVPVGDHLVDDPAGAGKLKA